MDREYRRRILFDHVVPPCGWALQIHDSTAREVKFRVPRRNAAVTALLLSPGLVLLGCMALTFGGSSMLWGKLLPTVLLIGAGVAAVVGLVLFCCTRSVAVPTQSDVLVVDAICYSATYFRLTDDQQQSYRRKPWGRGRAIVWIADTYMEMLCFVTDRGDVSEEIAECRRAGLNVVEDHDAVVIAQSWTPWL